MCCIYDNFSQWHIKHLSLSPVPSVSIKLLKLFISPDINRSVAMKRSLVPLCNYFNKNLESRKLLQLYMCYEFVIWTALSYSAVYYGKIFDYRHTDPSQFASRIDTNVYYSVMFGHLNLSQLDVKEQREIQGEAFFIAHYIRIFISFHHHETEVCCYF